MVSRPASLLAGLVALIVLGGVRPCRAQTVIPPDTVPPAPREGGARGWPDTAARARGDSGARATRPDSAPRPAPVAAPAAPLPSPHPQGICTDDVSAGGGEAPDLLVVTFLRRSKPADRAAALKMVEGTMVATDPSDPATWYVRVQSGGNEFALRAIADRLIRARSVSEVGPVQCPARP